MYTAVLALSGLALVAAQNPPAPTPSSAVMIEGDASYDGPVIPGTTGKLGNAQVVNGNPAGVVYQATLPSTNTFTNTGIRGYVQASSGANGVGTTFHVSLTGFPADDKSGPFIYHIHEKPVPADGNCTATMAHLDPYMRGGIPPCDSSQPATCQVGDLSGKHGNITTQSLDTTYTDPYVSLMPGANASLVGLSVVIHAFNTTRLTCANFLPMSSNSTSSNGTTGGSTGSGSGSTMSPGTTTAAFTGAANVKAISMGALATGALALFALVL